MTRRKQPKNKTIISEAMKQFHDDLRKLCDTPICAYCGLPEQHCKGGHIFPDDLDRIQPDQINGNLAIKFPE